ncbi:hypothetical protein BK735_21700 [Bacillus mycoides]|nr:hypothetical protein BK735_21700 [Bacillus mycoides]
MVYASRGSSGSENFEMKFVRKHNKIILLRKKVLLSPTEPFLKWQRVTLTLLFVYILQEC